MTAKEHADNVSAWRQVFIAERDRFAVDGEQRLVNIYQRRVDDCARLIELLLALDEIASFGR